VSIVKLADAIATASPLSAVPGLTTREGDGLPAPVADASWRGLRPERAETLPTVLGVSVARVLGSRGCAVQCPYCGSAALRRDARSEARRAGLSLAAMDEAHIGGRRPRPVADLADEIADLYHAKGARFFHLIDDNALTDTPADGTRWLRQVRGALDDRGVGRAAFSIMMEPSVVCDETLDALVDFGVVRALVGVEALTTQGLQALGRRGAPCDGVGAAARLRDRGIATVFNSILVHPASTGELLASELEAMPALSGVHQDALSMMVLPGTGMFEDLRRRRRVKGSLFGYDFTLEDPVAQRFRAILMLLSIHAKSWYGPGLYAHDVATNLAMGARLELAFYDASLQEKLAAISGEINKARVGAWRAALDLSATQMSDADRTRSTTALVLHLKRELEVYAARVDAIQAELERRARVSRTPNNRLFAPAYAGPLVVILAATGCGGSVSASSCDCPTPPACEAGATCPAPIACDATSGTGGGSSVEDTSSPPEVGCSDYDRSQSWSALDMVGAACETGTRECVQIVVDANGAVVDIGPDGGASPAVMNCLRRALAYASFPCFAGQTVTSYCQVIIK
jgi:hypothetical protein